jgi:hypothetical protein
LKPFETLQIVSKLFLIQRKLAIGGATEIMKSVFHL